MDWRPIDAAIEACRLRLRPILMTSFAFIMGVIPLVTASGAGSEMRQAIGIAVFAGMLGVTSFGLFLTPVFFVTIETWLARLRHVRRETAARVFRHRRKGAAPCVRRAPRRRLRACAAGGLCSRPELSPPRDASRCAFRECRRAGARPKEMPLERYWTVFLRPLAHAAHRGRDRAQQGSAAWPAPICRRRAPRGAWSGFDQFPTVTLTGGYTHNLDAPEQAAGLHPAAARIRYGAGRIRRLVGARSVRAREAQCRGGARGCRRERGDAARCAG